MGAKMRSLEENQWADEILTKAKSAGTIIGVKEIPKILSDYEHKFKKRITENSLTSWFWRRGKQIARKKPEVKTKHGKGYRHTEEEIQWARGAISRMKAEMRKVGHKAVQEMGLTQEFKTQFGRESSVGALYTWLKFVEGTKHPGKKKNLIGQLMDEITKYLLVADGIPLAFDSEKSLRAAIENPEVGHTLKSYRLYVATPFKINKSVSVSFSK